MKKISKKRFLNFLFILITLIVVFLLTANNTDLEDLGSALAHATPLWVLFALLSLFSALVFDVISLKYYLNSQGYIVKFASLFYISFMGQYFSNITPGASGGQPFQVYYLKKKDVPIGVSSSALAVKFFCNQFIYILVSLFFFLTVNRLATSPLHKGNSWILILGFIFHGFSVFTVFLLSINSHWVKWVLITLVNLFAKLRIVKKTSSLTSKIDDSLASFNTSVNMIKKYPLDLFIQLFFSFLQSAFATAVVYFIYLSFGLRGLAFWDVSALSYFLYISASHMPLPGASGAQEGGFLLYFKNVFPSAIIFPALLIWRFLTYYLQIMIGAIITVVHPILRRNKNI